MKVIRDIDAIEVQSDDYYDHIILKKPPRKVLSRREMYEMNIMDPFHASELMSAESETVIPELYIDRNGNE